MTDVETALAERAEGRDAGLGERAVTGRHLPALNGLRGVAVIGVVAYHLQLGWAKGGYLGVDLFFVLSGFLITTLLLEEWVGSGRIGLAAFWGRRARRLLPALFLVVAALAVYLVANGLWGGPGANGLVDLSGLRGDAIGTLLYVNNWHLIFAHQSYFAQFSTPSPLQHTWSLAIEEQFYLVWPLVLLLLFRVTRQGRRARAGRLGREGWRRTGLVLSVGLGVASSILMAVLFTPGVDPSRVYYGTDTRLFDLMAGATIAFVAAARPQPNERARRTLHVVAPLAGVALLAFWVLAGYTSGSQAGEPTNLMFEGGFLVCAALAGLVVADARLLAPGRLGRGLAWRPLHFIGTISYGIYLWHWPVIVYINGARTGLSTWPLDVLRVVVTLALSTASYYLIERPIRLARLHGWVKYWGAPLAGVATAALIVVATFPAVADPAAVASTTRLPASSGGTGAAALAGVPGAGGFVGQAPIHLAVTPSPSAPLRVMILGDSVMHDASFGITAALGATGEVNVATRTIPGFGLTTATNWPTSIPNLIRETNAQLIVASWSWDQYGPTAPNALHDPVAYTRLLRSAVATMLTPGNGVEGVIFTEFPQSGAIPAANPADQAPYNAARTAGVVAWNNIAKSMTKDFPGRVMYFPLADSVLLDGRYSAWLPPVGEPHAPAAEWTRVRKLDKVHLCAEGSVRYAAALLADMTSVLSLTPATGD
ncbi:MAG TPA: acyltransferase family protein, partial [Acidimicrobiales bacterium]